MDLLGMELTAAHLSIIRKLRGDTGREDLDADPAGTLAAMDKRYSVSSTRVALTALRHAYPACKAFEAEVKKRRQIYHKIDEAQTPTEKQKEKHVDWDDLCVWRDAHWNDLTLQERLLLGLYTFIAPQRLDYTPMLIVSRKPRALADGKNYLLVGKSSVRFIFHAYKTADQFGDREIRAPKRLEAVVREWLATRPGEPYLFGEGNAPWTEQRLGAAVRRIFQHHHNMDTGVSSLRHSYLTKKYEGIPDLKSLSKVQTDAGHGFLTSQKYRYIHWD